MDTVTQHGMAGAQQAVNLEIKIYVEMAAQPGHPVPEDGVASPLDPAGHESAHLGK